MFIAHDQGVPEKSVHELFVAQMSWCKLPGVSQLDICTQGFSVSAGPNTSTGVCQSTQNCLVDQNVSNTVYNVLTKTVYLKTCADITFNNNKLNSATLLPNSV